MDNEWKKSLRERFSDYASPEPEGLWEGIEQGMAGKPRRKMLPVWIVSGLAAAAAVALVVFLRPEKTLETSDLQKQGSLAESVRVDTTVAEPVEASEVTVVAGESVPFGVISRQPLMAEVSEPVQSVSVSDETVPDAVHEIVLVEEPTLADEPTPTGGPSVSVAEESVPDVSTFIPTEAEETFDIPEEIPVRGRKRFSVSAYGNGGQASSEQLRGYGMNRTSEYLQTRATGNSAMNDVGGMMRMLTSNRASTFDAHHAAPLRVGVTVAYGLTPHLNLVSGLNWTYLNSEFEETANPIRTVVGQDLGYLGVPLRLETAFNVWKGLWLSAGAGGMVEKGLLSSSWTNTWVDGQMAETVKNPKPDTGGLLWSVGAAAGAEYRFSPSFGLYLTPGVEYHFDNGAEVRSAYTEKPLHWNVNLGVRFHFGN